MTPAGRGCPRIGLREANQNFAKLVRAVRAGRTVILTDRGRPLARIEPLSAARGAAEAHERTLAELEAQGLLTRGRRRGPRPVTWPLVKVRGKSTTQLLREMRDERG